MTDMSASETSEKMGISDLRGRYSNLRFPCLSSCGGLGVENVTMGMNNSSCSGTTFLMALRNEVGICRACSLFSLYDPPDCREHTLAGYPSHTYYI